MSTEIRLHVLLVEDSEDDALLVLRELRRGGYDVYSERVETASDMHRVLQSRPWDVILSDYSMPQFNAPAALKVLQENGLDIPFIIVSGTIGEDAAVAALKAGAHDFFAKDKLMRLVPAIQREMGEVEVRRARAQAEMALQQHAERLKILHAIDQAILAAQTSEAVAQIGLRYFVEQVSTAGAAIVVFDFEGQTGIVLATQGRGADKVAAGTNFPLDEWPSEDFAALRAGAEQVIEDTTSGPMSPAINALQVTGFRSFLSVPLIAEDVVIAILYLGAESAAEFTPDYREIAREIASQLAIAMQQARLREQIERHAQELEQRVEERTTELRRSKERVEAILNNSSDAILFLTFDGIVHQVNPAFGELFGYTNDDILGHSLLNLATEDNLGPLLDAMFSTVNTGQPSWTDFYATRKSGVFFYAEMALAAIHEEGILAGLVCNVRDISGRKRMEAELRQALEQERELNELKSRFVSMVSHEFRTPLTAILSSSQLLKLYSDRMNDDKKATHLTKIELQVDHLTDMLDDVLTLGRVESVGLEFNPLPLDLVAFCRDLAEEIRAITRTPHEIVFSASGDCSKFNGDEKLLRQIITNLLTNAIKYSPQGGIVEFTVSCEPGQAVIFVSDEGIGIPEEDQKHLFEPFHRATNVGNIQGTGLGLPIVQRAVEAHNGTIIWESGVDMGTKFTVVLPTVIRGETGHDENPGD